MDVNFAPSFQRIFKNLDTSVKRNVKNAVSKVIDYYDSGSKTYGLGIKQLRGEIWEARSGLKIRVVFRIEGNTLTFVLAGNHDDVRNYLKKA